MPASIEPLREDYLWPDKQVEVRSYWQIAASCERLLPAKRSQWDVYEARGYSPLTPTPHVSGAGYGCGVFILYLSPFACHYVVDLDGRRPTRKPINRGGIDSLILMKADSDWRT